MCKNVKLETKVFSLVRQIPKGKVTTYQALAQKLGNKALARAVGNVLPKNKQLITIPCHRVVRNNGLVGDYVLGLAKKVKLLQNEGIKIRGNRIINFKANLYCFD